MFRLQRVLRSIKLSATKSFQRVPKTIIPEIKLCRYASTNTLAKCPLRSMPRLKGAYTVDITYRPARSEDLEDAERIVQVAGNELRLRHGRQPWPAPPPIAFPKFCLAEAPDGLWVAEHGGTIVGFGFSWMTETFWFLSQLFVKPETQAKGIGQALLSKALMQAERNRATNRALITPAYNTASTGLYLKNGFYPREPLYRMSAPAQSVAEKLADAGYDTTPIAPWPEPREWMAEIDGELLGFRRDMHHRFLLGGGAAHAVRIERACGTAGYAYISAEGHVGPLAVTRDADAKAVVTTVLRCALESEPSQVSMIVPGRADGVMQAVLALGLRLEEPYVLMASRPFGNWCNYLVRAPGFL
jgi:ribosomal protein S18 acetylase RimI-like enzyme